MKNLIAILTVATVLATPSCINASVSPKTIKCSGNIITETRTSEMQFNKISVSSAITLTIAERTDGNIIIRADDNVMPYLRLTAKNGTLTATTDKWYNFNCPTIEIEIPNNGRINEIEVWGAATLTAEPVLSAYEFDIDVSGAGRIKNLNVKADKCSIEASGASETNIYVESSECDIEASGASKIRVEGSSRKCEVGLSGTSRLDAQRFEVENYDIGTSGTSRADIFCTRSLEASASGVSTITYDGGCTNKEISCSRVSNISKR